MRRLNMLLVILMLVTFLLHGITGGLQLAGANILPQKALAWALMIFISAHIVITAILTFRTLNARRLSGAGYFKDNKLFWVRRISGFAIIIPIILHLIAFSPENAAPYRLKVFTTGRLVSQILLVISIAVHVSTNIKPMMISFGVKDRKALAVDILLILSVMLLLFGLAFVIYYIRWASV